MPIELNFTNRHVVVTGGTGALGAAVVETLVECGATCHIPSLHAADPKSFSMANHPQVRVVPGVDLTNESSVASFYGSVPSMLWASIHCAGGFAMSPLADTSLADFRKMIDTNAVTCFLCCREAVKRIRGGKDGG